MDRENKGIGKFWKGVLVGTLVTAFAGLVIVGVATGISVIGRAVMESQVQEQIAESSAASESEQQKLNMRAIGRKINTLEKVVDQYFLFDEDMQGMEDGIYKGMLAGLKDPYTVYYTPEEYEALGEETEGVYCGIGVLVSQNIKSGIVTALRVFPGSPAEEAGMKKGDILYKVGDIEATGEDLDMLVQEHIRGEEGTFVDLTVLRDSEEIPLHIERRMVEVATVEHRLLEDKTGYIMVTQFDTVTGAQFISAVDDLEAQGMERLVIDLRDNPGGVLESCVQMAAYVLPDDQFDGTILTTADKNEKGDRYFSADGKVRYESDGAPVRNPYFPMEDGHELNIPIAVLINGESASASEVFAGALQDYGVAKLVGTTSFGKGIVQSLLPLTDGSAVKITTAHYYTPAGHDLHKKGLTPDVEVEQVLDEELTGEYDIPFEKDNQLQKAVETLTDQASDPRV